MKTITHQFEYQVFDTEDELNPSDLEMLVAARSAIAGSYAPYSRFHVGAAVKLANGKVFTGSNQENMSFPAGLCAERVAIFSAGSAFPDVPVTVLSVSALSDEFNVTEPVPPCGVCRQAVMEYEMKFNHKIRVILGGQSGRIVIFESMGMLLPMAFMEKGLVKG